jgi:hypothetical protein
MIHMDGLSWDSSDEKPSQEFQLQNTLESWIIEFKIDKN